MKFVGSGSDESLYQTWKESGLNLSTFCDRNGSMVDRLREKFYVDNVVDV